MIERNEKNKTENKTHSIETIEFRGTYIIFRLEF